MKFGIFYEHQLPRPWENFDEHKLLSDALEQIELADKLGFDHVWEVEHHFLEEYSHSSAPEVFLGACSQRTSNIRLGHGIVAVPPGYNHPARVAERIATLDLISNGRLDFGTGETSSDMELLGFNVDRARKRAMWEEVVPQILRMMVYQPYPGYSGEFFDMPPRNIVPKPLQKPHPPVWVACSQPDTILMAARRGIGALCFVFSDEARQWVSDYYQAFEACADPIAFEPNPNIAIVTGLMCCQDEQEAIDKGLDGFHFFAYSLSHYYRFGQHRPGKTDVWSEFVANRDQFGFRKMKAQGGDLATQQRTEEGVTALRGAIGTPDQIRRYLRLYEDAGIDQVIFISQAGTNRHEDICESMDLFATAVMPEFKERDQVLAKRKAERLEPAMERLRALNPIVQPETDFLVEANPQL